LKSVSIIPFLTFFIFAIKGQYFIIIIILLLRTTETTDQEEGSEDAQSDSFLYVKKDNVLFINSKICIP